MEKEAFYPTKTSQASPGKSNRSKYEMNQYEQIRHSKQNKIMFLNFFPIYLV